MRIVFGVLTAWLVSSCTFFGNDEQLGRLEEGSTQKIEIPEGLDRPQFVDLMPIPEIEDPRGLAGTQFELRPPEPLSTRYGVDQIVIKRLDGDQWVFLDIPPAVVWPKIIQFWEANNLDVDSADPSTGELVSRWLSARGGDAESAFQSIRDASVYRNTRDVNLHQFKLRLEPGVRQGSSEVYLQQRQVSASAPFRLEGMAWPEASDDVDMETEVLRSLAYYLGENINQGTMSMMASNLVEGRTRLIPDRLKPELRYQLDFNRAWSTVGSALENAGVTVNDIDRSSQRYYVHYIPYSQKKPGFFRRLMGGGKKAQDAKDSYEVQLEDDQGEVLVTVFQQGELANGLIAERLLKVIKEYSI